MEEKRREDKEKEDEGVIGLIKGMEEQGMRGQGERFSPPRGRSEQHLGSLRLKL